MSKKKQNKETKPPEEVVTDEQEQHDGKAPEAPPLTVEQELDGVGIGAAGGEHQGG